jgi:hypothetical protein
METSFSFTCRKTLAKDLFKSISNGNKIDAIKYVRVATGCGLRCAKEYVDRFLPSSGGPLFTFWPVPEKLPKQELIKAATKIQDDVLNENNLPKGRSVSTHGLPTNIEESNKMSKHLNEEYAESLKKPFKIYEKIFERISHACKYRKKRSERRCVSYDCFFFGKFESSPCAHETCPLLFVKET